MHDRPQFFIPGLHLVGETIIWFTPDGQPLILSCPLSGWGERYNAESNIEDDDLDPDLPF